MISGQFIDPLDPGQIFKAYAAWPQIQLMLPKLRVVIGKLAERLPASWSSIGGTVE
ncbi:hypothetical protein I6F07_30130 [Ensifer sp. IC4062]|nr:hypothetical protein [Ensifer sp. IC4062]MCA1444372.1 hypothetical protein [Ensifer sp. IC4062]